MGEAALWSRSTGRAANEITRPEGPNRAALDGPPLPLWPRSIGADQSRAAFLPVREGPSSEDPRVHPPRSGTGSLLSLLGGNHFLFVATGRRCLAGPIGASFLYSSARAWYFFPWDGKAATWSTRPGHRGRWIPVPVLHKDWRHVVDTIPGPLSECSKSSSITVWRRL